jgi:hypothetical protein
VTKKKAAIVAGRGKIKNRPFVRGVARICHVALALNQACHVPGCADASIVPTLTKTDFLVCLITLMFIWKFVANFKS